MLLRSQSTEPPVEPPVEPPAEPPAEPPVEQSLTVFEGSSPEDVSHARRLWSSLSLLPPQESRLVSADVRQRLPVSRPQQQRGTAGSGPSAVPEPHLMITAREKQRRDERRRYEAMAENRRQILRLLKKQREQRIQKEALSVTHKPKPKEEPEEPDQNRDRAEGESDRDLVLQLP